jgi:hypothetical protein
LRKDAINALAHYHLGFALGMVNHRTAELREYRRGETLGLRNWDLFLNMGLAQLESILTILPNESCRSVVCRSHDSDCNAALYAAGVCAEHNRAKRTR